jgi:hypothetical protein
VFRHDIDGDQILTANQSAEDTLQPQILVAFPQRNVELAQIPYRKVTSEQRQFYWHETDVRQGHAGTNRALVSRS